MISFEGVMMGQLVITMMLLIGGGDISVEGGEKIHFMNAVVLINPNEPLPWSEMDFNRSPPQAPQPYYSRVENHCFANRKVFYRGNCWSLLQRGPCQDGEWLVLDPSYLGVKPFCQPRRCPSDKAYWEPTAECIPLSDKNKCPKKQTSLQVDSLGYGACKCMNGIARAMASNGACYKLYSRGFCDEGYMVAYNTEADQYPATCVPDPCVTKRRNSTDPNEIVLSYRGSCYPDGSHDPCPEDHVLSVDVHTYVPTCTKELNTWHIVNPQPICPLVDHENKCRDKITVNLETANFKNGLAMDKTKHSNKFNKG